MKSVFPLLFLMLPLSGCGTPSEGAPLVDGPEPVAVTCETPGGAGHSWANETLALGPEANVGVNATLLWAASTPNGAVGVDLYGENAGLDPGNFAVVGQFVRDGEVVQDATGAWAAVRLLYVASRSVTYTYDGEMENRQAAFSFDEPAFAATLWNDRYPVTYQNESTGATNGDRIVVVVAWGAPANATFELAVGWQATTADHQLERERQTLMARPIRANLIPGSCSSFSALSYHHDPTGTSYNRVPGRTWNANVTRTPVADGAPIFDLAVHLHVERAGTGWGEVWHQPGHLQAGRQEYQVCGTECTTYARDPPFLTGNAALFFQASGHSDVVEVTAANRLGDYDAITPPGPGRTLSWLLATDLDVSQSTSRPVVELCMFPARNANDVDWALRLSLTDYKCPKT